LGIEDGKHAVSEREINLIMHLLPPATEHVRYQVEFRRQRDTFRAHAEAARRAALTPKQRAYEDWSHAWYRKNEYEDRETELNAFEAASKEWNKTH
jgi:hypothetical protein